MAIMPEPASLQAGLLDGAAIKISASAIFNNLSDTPITFRRGSINARRILEARCSGLSLNLA
ncbi:MULTISPECIES: hypothetical protein [unclassified Bradyrhizobium]|uniref:hypothetical protein n=1 Tax=Bradyrhizobium sp. USDA 4541 TaxID=2817704 RepID=UPI0020A51511|nr:hypothetical protein [Bradyrhizobium sp. USDA 4541]MCP1848377.1 hypothetical protein [Bradyrhizobium sp. USDA 4541]